MYYINKEKREDKNESTGKKEKENKREEKINKNIAFPKHFYFCLFYIFSQKLGMFRYDVRSYFFLSLVLQCLFFSADADLNFPIHIFFPSIFHLNISLLLIFFFFLVLLIFCLYVYVHVYIYVLGIVFYQRYITTYITYGVR